MDGWKYWEFFIDSSGGFVRRVTIKEACGPIERRWTGQAYGICFGADRFRQRL